MPRNRGATSLKCRRSKQNPMREYDRLPLELRIWLTTAALPWRARSVQVAYDKARIRTGDAALALEELNRMQRALIAKDASRVWGPDHPDANAE